MRYCNSILRFCRRIIVGPSPPLLTTEEILVLEARKKREAAEDSFKVGIYLESGDVPYFSGEAAPPISLERQDSTS